MEREQRQHAKRVVNEVSALARRAIKLVQERDRATSAQAQALQQFTDRIARHGPTNQMFWRTLNLGQGDDHLVTAAAHGHQLPALAPDARRAIDELTGHGVTRALSDAKSVLGARRMFSSKDKKDTGSRAVEWLSGFHTWLATSDFYATLADLARCFHGGAAVGSCR